MTRRTQQARAVFDKAAAAHRAEGKPDAAANVELCREYFTNPKFRVALQAHIWEELNR